MAPQLRYIQMLIMVGPLLIGDLLLVIVCSSVEILSLGEARSKILLLDLVPKHNIESSPMTYKR